MAPAKPSFTKRAERAEPGVPLAAAASSVALGFNQ